MRIWYFVPGLVGRRRGREKPLKPQLFSSRVACLQILSPTPFPPFFSLPSLVARNYATVAYVRLAYDGGGSYGTSPQVTPFLRLRFLLPRASAPDRPFDRRLLWPQAGKT